MAHKTPPPALASAPESPAPPPDSGPSGDGRPLDLADKRRRAQVARTADVKPEELLAAHLHPDRLVAVTTDGRKIAVTALPGDAA